jgi:hypothetical protein
MSGAYFGYSATAKAGSDEFVGCALPGSE